MVNSCAMHTSISYVLNLQLFYANSCECCHDRCITEATHIAKMLEQPWKQGSMATEFIHIEEISSHTHNRKVLLLMYLSYDVVLTRHVLHHKTERKQR